MLLGSYKMLSVNKFPEVTDFIANDFTRIMLMLIDDSLIQKNIATITSSSSSSELEPFFSFSAQHN